MNGSKGRSGHADATAKGNDGSGGDGFGNEIERMLMDRPLTRQAASGAVACSPTVGAPSNTLDELMAELGMLRGERGELSSPAERQYGRNGTRTGPRMSAGDGSLLGGSGDGALRPGTPRTSAIGTFGPLVLPPAKGALPVAPISPAAGSAGPAAVLGPVRSQSPMSTRRSVPGVGPGPSPGPNCGLQNTGSLSPAVPGVGPPPAGMLERQTQLEARLEKMESREQQLMALISQLQQQVSTLTRAQQATQQQLASYSSTGPPPAATAPAPAAASGQQQPSPRQAATASAATAPSQPPATAVASAPPHVSDEDFIQNDDDPSPQGSPKQRSAGAQGRPAAVGGPQPPGGQRLGTPPAVTPVPPATGAPGGGRPNKLVPQLGPPADWEADVSQLRKEVGALAATVVRLREQLATLVPGGASLLSEEVSSQAAAAAQLKQNLTQIAMDVVSLHKGLTTLKQNTDRNYAALEKSICDMQVQAQTNALNLLTSSPAAVVAGGGVGQSNAVAAALAATGGVSGSLEESLRSAFAKPAMRALPVFNTADMGFMPDNSGAAAAVSAFGGMGVGGGGGAARKEAPPANTGGGLGAAWALLNSFEEQAAAEKEEQQKAAIIARQAVSIVDAKVKQVVMHVDRHMQMISSDVEERLRMYEQTIIRMAQQIDRVQRVLKDIEGAAASRIVVRHGGKELDEEMEEARREPPQEEPPEARTNAKENWFKAAAMATGRFVPQKEEKKPATRASPHGYFRTPA